MFLNNHNTPSSSWLASVQKSKDFCICNKARRIELSKNIYNVYHIYYCIQYSCICAGCQKLPFCKKKLVYTSCAHRSPVITNDVSLLQGTYKYLHNKLAEFLMVNCLIKWFQSLPVSTGSIIILKYHPSNILHLAHCKSSID